MVEGIFDGRAVDGCFLCELLYPDTHVDDCPRCGRRMRYQPAVMMNETALRDTVRSRALAYLAHIDAEPLLRQARLIELLEHLHRFAPTSLVVLGELGKLDELEGSVDALDLDRLRRDYQALADRAL